MSDYNGLFLVLILLIVIVAAVVIHYNVTQASANSKNSAAKKVSGSSVTPPGKGVPSWTISNDEVDILILENGGPVTTEKTLLYRYKQKTGQNFRNQVLMPFLNYCGVKTNFHTPSQEEVFCELQKRLSTFTDGGVFSNSSAVQTLKSPLEVRIEPCRLFEFLHDTDLEHVFDMYRHHVIGFQSPDLGQAVITLGVGGLYRSAVNADVKTDTLIFKAGPIDSIEEAFKTNTSHSVTVVHVRQFLGYSEQNEHVVSMPSITQDVIEKMKSKNMTNIPYYGRLYRAAGYLVIEVRLDNEIYVFCSALGYHYQTSYDDVCEKTIVDDLVKWRARRDPRLEKTDYGYVLDKDTAPVYWYV